MTSRSAAAPGTGEVVPGTRPTGRPATASGRRRPWRTHLLGYGLVAPLVLVMLGVIGYPLLNTVLLSLQNQGVVGSASTFVGLDNYTRAFGDGAFWASIGRSAIWLLGNLVVQTIIAFGTALLIGRNGRWARASRTWVLIPWVIPTVAVAVIWQWLSNSNYGIVPKLGAAVGVDGLGSPFGDSALAMPALILMNSWHWFPLGAVVIFGALRTIPGEIYEAARVDGADSWRIFWRITFPLLQPVLFALGLVGSLWSFNIVDSIYLVTKGGPADATTTAPVFIYGKAFNQFQASDAATVSVITIILLAAVAFFYIRVAKPKEDA
ncbi:carbohydrate ABC transporter permease [Plantactinospora endophytica]|uniref:Sugar ABC transporter permease n=1 Tax=Plantactinospora endophytica TaxID=673535 RepID=A0ABQ4E6U8_9ACTN|nr:sugar ABC transporter permease [Plantactinospora endophytica]GIG90446.1 sugar ABC transporter permease [Plantactinospora endophytica]